MAIRGYPSIVHLHRVCRVPHAQFRVIVPRAVVIQPCLLVQFLAVEEIRRFIAGAAEPPLHEDLAPRGVLHQLHGGPEAVGHRHRAAEMVAVVEVNLAVAVQVGQVAVLCGVWRVRCIVTASLTMWDGQVQVPAAIPCVGVQRLVGDTEMTVYGVDGGLLRRANGTVIDGNFQTISC